MRDDVRTEANMGIVRVRLQLDQMRQEIRQALLKYSGELQALAEEGIKRAVTELPRAVADMARQVIRDELRGCLESMTTRVLGEGQIQLKLIDLIKANLQEAVNAALKEHEEEEKWD